MQLYKELYYNFQKGIHFPWYMYNLFIISNKWMTNEQK